MVFYPSFLHIIIFYSPSVAAIFVILRKIAAEYRRQLREHHFFDDLLREKDECYREAMAHLCIHLYEDVGELIVL